MEFYTLDPWFRRDEVIDEFASGIWTERFTAAGDVKLVLPATRERVRQMANGTFLALKGSKEVMLLDTQSIEDGMLTVTGNTLEKFLEERNCLLPGRSSGAGQVSSAVRKNTPGNLISYIIRATVLGYDAPFVPGVPWADSNNPNQISDQINNLSFGVIDSSGDVISIEISYGQSVYSQILPIAETHNLGIALYLDAAGEDFGYSLKFSVRKGLDRTSKQTINELIRFSPELDSLANIKELRSVTGYKGLVRVSVPQALRNLWGGTFADPVWVWSPSLPKSQSQGFNLRIADIFVDEITEQMMNDFMNGEAYAVSITDLLKQKGREYLVKNNRTRVIDGEVVPQPGYVFGKDYRLGDIVEVENYSGKLQNVRVTEYIRSQDETGERGYPTLSQIDPPPPIEEGADRFR